MFFVQLPDFLYYVLVVYDQISVVSLFEQGTNLTN